MDAGELLTRWSIRLALTCYVLALGLRVSGRDRPLRLKARLFWTAGCALLLLHVACAFHFFHDWSHHAAYEATARDTAAVTGLSWGGGVYANYLFALLWGADAVWWWWSPRGYLSRSRGVEWSIQGYLAFIAIHATVVFESGPVRWISLAAALWLLVLRVRRNRNAS